MAAAGLLAAIAARLVEAFAEVEALAVTMHLRQQRQQK
jgi:hypothetical protein